MELSDNYKGLDTVEALYIALSALIDSLDSVPPNSMVGAVVDRRLISNGLKACQKYQQEQRKGVAARKKYGDEH